MAPSWSSARTFEVWRVKACEPHHQGMDSSKRKLCLGDRVRRNGFFGVFEVIRVLEGGSQVDIKHLDLCGPNFIERGVTARDLTFLCASRPPASFAVAAATTGGGTEFICADQLMDKPLAPPRARSGAVQRVRLHA